jgi:hypothetical protein
MAISLHRTLPARWAMFGERMSLVRRATVARRDIFLSANSFGGPQFSRVEIFGFWRRRSAASFRSLRHSFLGSPTDIIVAFSAGISVFCATSAFA